MEWLLLPLLVIILVPIGRRIYVGHKALERPLNERQPVELDALILAARFGKPVEEGQDDGFRTGREAPPGSVQDTPDWGVPPFAESDESRDRLWALAAAGQGAWYGTGALGDLAEIDENVYAAMSQLAGKQLETIGDLHQYISEWPSFEMGDSLPEGALNKLMGHLAEPAVAENIRNLGIPVEMPDVSNMAGYDLILNHDHAVNVKTVSDVASLSHHFDKYPDIPVVVPGDMTGLPEDAIHLAATDALELLEAKIQAGSDNVVLVDDALSHADMVEHADAVGDGWAGNIDLDGIGSGVPLITVALSGLREVRLLIDDRTEFETAFKNLALDVAGTGLGGIGGAKAGALMGSAFAPGVGTVVGALVGGITGAIAGRAVTNSVKTAPFQEACDEYDRVAATAKTEQEEVQLAVTSRFQTKQEQIETHLIEEAAVESRGISQIADRLSDECRPIGELRLSEARAIVERAFMDLRTDRAALESLYEDIPWLNRVLWPTSLTGRAQVSMKRLDRLTKLLTTQVGALLGGRSSQTLSASESERLLRLVTAVGVATDEVFDRLVEWQKKRLASEAGLRKMVEDARTRLVEKRYLAMKELVRKLEECQQEAQERLRPLVEEFERAQDRLRQEADRLGLELEV